MAQATTIGPSYLKPGEWRSVDVGGTRVGIANVDGQLYAFHDECTHEQCPLIEEGELDGHVITCGCHGAQFDVRTGTVLAPPAPSPISVFPLRVVDGQIVIES
jgi:nitrite reductase/ring-hydroxylating ferredoxin subunit